MMLGTRFPHATANNKNHEKHKEDSATDFLGKTLLQSAQQDTVLKKLCDDTKPIHTFSDNSNVKDEASETAQNSVLAEEPPKKGFVNSW